MKYGNFTDKEIGDYSKLNIINVSRQIDFMNKIRNHFNVPIVVSSWIRDEQTQSRLIKERKSSIFSQHPKGTATDTTSLNHIPPEIIIPVSIIYGAVGIGVYFRNGQISHYHLDTRVDNISLNGYNIWYINKKISGEYETIFTPKNIQLLARNVYKALEVKQ